MIGRRTRQVTLLLILLAVGAAVAARLRAAKPTDAPSPSWPPFEPARRSPTAAEPAARPFVATTPAPAQAEQARWVAPVDGACPDGYPIKANDNSGIFHVPSGRFYARTVPERCYAVAAEALADGYRQAKA